MPNKSVITYDGLPVSSGGAHTLKSRDPSLALAQVMRFLGACTAAQEPMQCSVELVSGAGIPNTFSDRLLSQLDNEYGRHSTRGLGPNTGHRWQIPLEVADTMAKMISGLSPMPVHPHGLQPIALEVQQKFCFVSQDDRKELLPHQGAENYANFAPGYGLVLGRSQLYARISEKSHVSVFLCFPFAEPTSAFFEYRKFIQENLPFKMSDAHWKLWRLTKRGDSYIGRKLANSDT